MDSNEEETETFNRKLSKPKPIHQKIEPPITQYPSSPQPSKIKFDEGETKIAMVDDFSGYVAELDGKVKSMMEQAQNMISYGKGKMKKANVCKICGKEGQIVAIRDHIEANHL